MWDVACKSEFTGWRVIAFCGLYKHIMFHSCVQVSVLPLVLLLPDYVALMKANERETRLCDGVPRLLLLFMLLSIVSVIRLSTTFVLVLFFSELLLGA